MKKYTSSLKKIDNNLKPKISNIIKSILKAMGLKKIIYFIFSKIISLFLKSGNSFVRGIIFDINAERGKYSFIENNYGEKYVLLSKDKVISKEIFINDQFELEKLKKTLNFLSSSHKVSTLYDIGANLGITCIPAIKRGLIKKAYAVEPEKENFEILKTNILLNNLQNKIEVFNCALSDEKKSASMEISPDNSGDHRVLQNVNFNIHGEEDRETQIIKTELFDDLFTDVKREKDLIWIDTQGHEPKVLKGAKSLIKNKIPIVIEFWPYALKRNGLWELMIKNIENFDFYIDLSMETLEQKRINSKSINNLAEGWDKEKYNKHSLFTDLLLLKE
tara:strand:- start:3473 stop:4471 length:999 start_codon:yes stop_codon:yes gene_type:complete